MRKIRQIKQFPVDAQTRIGILIRIRWIVSRNYTEPRSDYVRYK
jgi:hypothetical protein